MIGNDFQVRRGDQRQRVVPAGHLRGRAQPLVRDHRGEQVQERGGDRLDQAAAAGLADVRQQQHGVRQLVRVGAAEQADHPHAQGKAGRAGHFQGHSEQQDRELAEVCFGYYFR